MHSSRMRTVRCSGRRGVSGGGSAQGGVCWGGVCPGGSVGGGGLTRGGVSQHALGRGVSAPVYAGIQTPPCGQNS